MRRFKAGEIHVLVSTTVIEVGIDVPERVRDADRARGALRPLAAPPAPRARRPRAVEVVLHPARRRRVSSEDAQRRLDAMVETNDGFRIAEADLELRGPGEFFGTRQSGLPEFRVADLLRDGALLEEARGRRRRSSRADRELRDSGAPRAARGICSRAGAASSTSRRSAERGHDAGARGSRARSRDGGW